MKEVVAGVWNSKAEGQTVRVDTYACIMGWRMIRVQREGDVLYKGRVWKRLQAEVLAGRFTHMGTVIVDGSRAIVLRQVQGSSLFVLVQGEFNGAGLSIK